MFKFDKHRFIPGEYVSLTKHDGVQRPFFTAIDLDQVIAHRHGEDCQMKWFHSLAIGVAIIFASNFSASAGDSMRGERIAKSNCAPCHAIGRTGGSPNPDSPPFRTLRERYPLTDLEEALAEGTVLGREGVHMPVFKFRPQQVEDLIAYLLAIQPPSQKP